MYELRLLAQFDKTPPEVEQKKIESDIRCFLQDLVPDIELHVTSGQGSWWIVVEGTAMIASSWLMLPVASWGVKKGLDKLSNRISVRIAQKSESMDISPVPELAQSTDTEQIPDGIAVDQLVDMGLKLNELSTRIGAQNVRIGLFHNGRGLVVSREAHGDEVSFKITDTDSRDIFDADTTPRQ